MRISEPRLAPLNDDELDSETLERLGGSPMLNIFRTLAHHPKLLKRWLVFGAHVLGKNTLSDRDRELLILRTGWVRGSEYEWTQHVEIGLAAGLSQNEIEQIAVGPDAEGLSDFDRAQLRAVDELCGDAFISDETWKVLSARYNNQQLLDLVFSVGQYNLVSMALNTLGVRLEDESKRLPENLRPLGAGDK